HPTRGRGRGGFPVPAGLAAAAVPLDTCAGVDSSEAVELNVGPAVPGNDLAMLADPPGKDGAAPARVLVLYNEPVLGDDHPDAVSEHEILDTVGAVERALAGAGYEVRRLGVSRDPGCLAAGLRQHRPDVVFNLFEGLADHGDTEAHVAG